MKDVIVDQVRRVRAELIEKYGDIDGSSLNVEILRKRPKECGYQSLSASGGGDK